MPRSFLTAEWRSLVVLNYEIDPAVLTPMVPRGVELDLWQGRAVVSMVGFLFVSTRLLGFPVPWHRNFEEVNLRFYVRRRVDEEWRRGVVFVREIVPRLAIAYTARAIYNEPYLALPMRYRVEGNEREFSWRFRGRWNVLGAETSGDAQPLVVGSEEEFIYEHYWGYTRQRDGGTVEYQVEHPPWTAWQASRSWLDCDVAGLYGLQFVEALGAAPRSAYIAEGSPVCVRSAMRLK